MSDFSAMHGYICCPGCPGEVLSSGLHCDNSTTLPTFPLHTVSVWLISILAFLVCFALATVLSIYLYTRHKQQFAHYSLCSYRKEMLAHRSCGSRPRDQQTKSHPGVTNAGLDDQSMVDKEDLGDFLHSFNPSHVSSTESVLYMGDSDDTDSSTHSITTGQHLTQFSDSV